MAIKYKLKLGIGISNCNQEDEVGVQELGYSDDVWNTLSPHAQEKELDNYVNEWVYEFIDAGWELKED